MDTAVPVQAYIGLGSNLGDGRILLRQAWAALGEKDGIMPETLSSPYLSAPVGMDSTHWFTNAAGCLRTSLPPLELLRALMAVEARFGRIREGRGYRDRSLDLDLLYYENVVMNTPELILPHPRLGSRLFVLSPLAELEPGLKDSFTGKTVAEMEDSLHLAIAAGEVEMQEIVRSCWQDELPAEANTPRPNITPSPAGS